MRIGRVHSIHGPTLSFKFMSARSCHRTEGAPNTPSFKLEEVRFDHPATPMIVADHHPTMATCHTLCFDLGFKHYKDGPLAANCRNRLAFLPTCLPATSTSNQLLASPDVSL